MNETNIGFVNLFSIFNYNNFLFNLFILYVNSNFNLFNNIYISNFNNIFNLFIFRIKNYILYYFKIIIIILYLFVLNHLEINITFKNKYNI